MGDYAVYVWSAYAAAGSAVVLLTLYAVLDYRSQAAALARLDADRERRDG